VLFAKSITVKQYNPPYDLILTGISPNKYRIVIKVDQKTSEIGIIERYHFTGGKEGHYWHGFVGEDSHDQYRDETITIEPYESIIIDDKIKHEIQNSIYLLLSRNNLTVLDLMSNPVTI
jgi:hypothetical protein